MRAETILVTGATGFIGRALVARLVDEGRRVRAAVRSQASHLPPEVQAVTVGDIGPRTDWTEALHGVHAVVHLAAHAHVVRGESHQDHERYRIVNTLGTQHLAAAAARDGRRRFVFLSSVRAHGTRTGDTPFTEASPLAALDPYGRSKAEAERLVVALARESALEAVALRPPLVYGPGVKGNFARLLALVAHGVPLPLGGLRNRRSMLYLENLIDAILQALDHPAAAGRSFLLSDGESVSTAELVHGIARALGKPARSFAVPVSLLRFGGAALGKSDDLGRLVDDLVVDSALIRTTLGWTPRFTLDQGLAEVAAWYRGIQSGPGRMPPT